MRIVNLGNRNRNNDYLNLMCRKGDDVCFLYVAEGTGENLFDEDIEDGYIDYIMWDEIIIGNKEIKEGDGGMFMTKELIVDYPNRLLDFVETIAREAGIPDDWEITIL